MEHRRFPSRARVGIPTSLTRPHPVSHLDHQHIVLRGQLAEPVLEVQHGLHQCHDIVVHGVVGPVQVGCGLNGLKGRDGWPAAHGEPEGSPIIIIHSWECTDINPCKDPCFATSTLSQG